MRDTILLPQGEPAPETREQYIRDLADGIRRAEWEGLERSDAFGLLTGLGHRLDVTVAADDYTRRRLGLTDTCGEGFLRVNLDGSRDDCCFAACEYRREFAGATGP